MFPNHSTCLGRWARAGGGAKIRPFYLASDLVLWLDIPQPVPSIPYVVSSLDRSHSGQGIVVPSFNYELPGAMPAARHQGCHVGHSVLFIWCAVPAARHAGNILACSDLEHGPTYGRDGICWGCLVIGISYYCSCMGFFLWVRILPIGVNISCMTCDSCHAIGMAPL